MPSSIAIFNLHLPAIFPPVTVGLMKPGQTLTFIVEKHADGYVAYPFGLKGVVVGQGDSYEDALASAKSAARFHIETFGSDIFDTDSDVEKVYVAEASLS